MMVLGQYRAVLVGSWWYGSVWGGTVWYLVVLGQNRMVLVDIWEYWVSTIKTIIIVTFYRHHHSSRFIMVRNCRSLLPPLKVQPGHSLLFLEPGCHLLLHLERRRKSPLIRFRAEMLLFSIISVKVFKWRFGFKWSYLQWLWIEQRHFLCDVA